MGCTQDEGGGRRLLAEAFELARTIDVDLDEEYLRGIAWIESHALNQPYADKSWVWEAEDAAQRHFALAERVG